MSFSDELVEVPGGDARGDRLLELVQDLGHNPPGLTHQRNLLGAFQLHALARPYSPRALDFAENCPASPPLHRAEEPSLVVGLQRSVSRAYASRALTFSSGSSSRCTRAGRSVAYAGSRGVFLDVVDAAVLGQLRRPESRSTITSSGPPAKPPRPARPRPASVPPGHPPGGWCGETRRG